MITMRPTWTELYGKGFLPSQYVAASGITHRTTREKDHSSNNAILGLPDDPPTKALFENMKRSLMKEQP
jgi:hypothetical protein